ncbi:hypothetical protein [Terrisporobacter sp.]
MKYSKMLYLILCIVFIIVGCSSIKFLKKNIQTVDINNIKNSEKLILDSIYNVNYKIENQGNYNYEVVFTLIDNKGNKEDQWKIYMDRESLLNNKDMLVSINIGTDEYNEKYEISQGLSALENNKVVDSNIVISDLNWNYTQGDLSFENIKINSSSNLDTKIPIISIYNEGKEVYKIYMQIIRKDS